jgi:hypothetical protein
MRSYRSSATIAAPPEQVWAVLAATDQWSSWDSGVIAVDGQLSPGEKVTIRTLVSPSRSFPVAVEAVQPPRLLRLRGGMPFGLFTGVRNYSLERAGAGSTLFTVTEEYTGPLLGLIWRTMPNLQPSFDQFAAGLKQRVEAGA